MVGSSQQRNEVWRGTRTKTSGGLVKKDLIKNKRGKIVSRKKSDQAGAQNNLGHWLREKGKKIEKADMLRKKSDPPDAAQQKSKNKSPKVKPKAKAVPKPKAPAPKAPAPKPKAAKKAPKPQGKPKRKKLKAKPGINPITKQAYDKKSKSGYVEKGAVSLDNIKMKKLRPKKAAFDYGGAAW